MMSRLPSTDSSSDESSVANPVSVQMAAPKEVKESNSQKQLHDWVNESSLDDVVFSETEWFRLGKDEDHKTRLQSIKGLSPSMLTVLTLKRLCVQYRITAYKNKAKHVLCELIVNAARTKNLDAEMFPEDFAAKAVAKKDSSDKTTKSTKKKTSKSQKPEVVQHDGTLYRVIVTYFLQEVRPYVIKLGSQPGKDALDKREILHQSVFERLAKVYNDEAREDLKTLPYTHEMYAKWNLSRNIPSYFDHDLTALDISQILDFINFHYKDRMRDCRRSGSHDEFYNFVRTKPFLFVYHQCLMDAQIELQDLAFSQLDENVKRESTTSTNKSKGASRKKKTNKKQRGMDSKNHQITSALQKMGDVSC
jgi:hypothetical protein